jgi:hypothetical protein
MPGERRVFGYGLVALAAAGLLASLWAPWYRFRIPDAALNTAVQSAQQFGILGPIIRQGASLLRQLGPLHVTAWQAFTFTPAVLLVVGVVAGALALLTLTERAADAARVIVVAGTCGVAMTGYRIVERPGASGFIHPAWGVYLSLACAAAVVVGGLIARAAEDAEARIPAPVSSEFPSASAWSTTSSIAPPARTHRS